MFPDSASASKFACGERKSNYLCTFGIAPYFQNLLRQKLRDSQRTGAEYVLLFDESLNPSMQTKQMDVMVRIWDANRVRTRYLTSKFLGHAYAETIQEELYDCCSSLGLRGLLQLSMDGPHVNWKAFDLLNAQVETETRRKLLDVGSCGLHTVHNAFKSGWQETDWDLQHSFTSLYWLFKDTPARREDFTSLTGSRSFPKRFCQTRWLENIDVADRVIEIWPDVERYVAAVRSRQFPEPKTKSWSVVSKCCDDLLFIAKVHAFRAVAEDVTPFLRKYQSDLPLLPFLGDDLASLIRTLLRRFVKVDVLAKATTTTKLVQLPFTDTAIHVDSSKIDVRFASSKILSSLKKKVSCFPH